MLSVTMKILPSWPTAKTWPAKSVTGEVRLQQQMAQTQKLAKKMLVIIYGSEYWNRIVDFQALVGDSTDNVPGVPLIGPLPSMPWKPSMTASEG